MSLVIEFYFISSMFYMFRTLQYKSRNLLMMDVLISETCGAEKK